MVLVENYAGHHQRWLKCFNDPAISDVVFEAKDGQTFHCEKFVLEVASPYFKKLFSSGKCGGSSKLVSAIDVDAAALKWILRACYTADGDLNDENVVSVMLAAKTYEMGWVEKACMDYLKKDNSGPVVKFEYSKEHEKWQEWRVPHAGWYHIVAMGAKAVDAHIDAQLYQAKGGDGAIIGASFELKADDVVQILTGGMSRIWSNPKYPNRCGGGAGGTFVALKEKELSLLVAAGGGGGFHVRNSGSDANLGENGIGSHPKYPGGKNGANGASTDDVFTGGLGWKAGPKALAKPSGNGQDENGGFGGGGHGSGGGGGYSGGGCGWELVGGGGGSYVAHEARNTWKRLANRGHGKVYIWGGMKVPAEETFFMMQVGSTGEGKQTNEESIDSWEILD